MKLNIFATLSILLISLGLHAQSKRANWWYFGNKAVLNFNVTSGGQPQALSIGSMVQQEGSSSISDENGKLLFYSNGISVWDANHNQMTNGSGLMGNQSSTASALIAPHPGDTNKYFIFTTAAVNSSGNAGLRYSIVDMKLRSGLGDVVASSKNTLLFSPSCERVVAIKRRGGGYWIIGQEYLKNIYQVFSVSNAGVSSTAIKSTIGPAASTLLHGIGQMKASSNGLKVANCYYSSGTGTGYVTMMDFNPSTGVLSNALFDTTKMATNYGLEFSNDASKLYVANFNDSVIYQYNAKSTTQAAFRSSQRAISATGVARVSAMQLGPDHKIYLNIINSKRLSVIQYPNNLGVACSLSAAGPTIPGAGGLRVGLPSFPSMYFETAGLSVSNLCAQSLTKFALTDTTAIDSVLLFYGDSSAGKANFTKSLPAKHTYAKGGTYKLTTLLFYTQNNAVLIDTLINSVHISSLAKVSLGPDTVMCQGDSLKASIISSTPYTFLWHDSSTAKGVEINSRRNYWIEVKNKCGVMRDSVNIYSLIDSLNLGNDTLICAGDSLSLSTGDTITSYLWSNGDTTSHAVFKQKGTVWLQISNRCGSHSDTFKLRVGKPTVRLKNDTSICRGALFILDVTQLDSAVYTWHNSSPNPIHYVSTAGLKHVTVSNKCGSTSDSMIVHVDFPLNVYLPNDTTICKGDSFLLQPLSPLPNYNWNTGSTDSSLWVSKVGIYSLSAFNVCNADIDSIRIRHQSPPIVQLPSDQFLCPDDSILIASLSKLPNYQWSTGQNDSSIWVSKAGIYTLSSSNLCGQGSDSLSIQQHKVIIPIISRNVDTLISSPAKAYQWHESGVVIPQATHQRLTITKIGNYHVVTTDSNNCLTSSQTEEVTILYVTVEEKMASMLSRLVLFPNPTNKSLSIDFKNVKAGDFNIQLTDVRGKILESTRYNTYNMPTILHIDMTPYSIGHYLIRISNDESTEVFKVVKGQ